MLTLLILLTIHMVADFLIQTDHQALNKARWTDAFNPDRPDNTGLLALLTHCLTYSACFLLYGWQFWLITFLTHLVTDAITSRAGASAWYVIVDRHLPSGRFIGRYDLDSRGTFWGVVGFDQLIHAWTLGLTYLLLFGRPLW